MSAARTLIRRRIYPDRLTGELARDVDDSLKTLYDFIDDLESRVSTVEAEAGGTPAAHASTHQNGGTDEISVSGLSGLLADGQTPLAHHTSHESSGSDSIKLDDLATPDDNTDLNASTSRHGLLRKLSNSASDVLDGTGAWNSTFDSRLDALENVSPLITQWTPDAPPTGSAHAKSDEFDSGSAWNARWSEFDQSAELTPSVADGFGIMEVLDQGVTNRTVGMYQAVPAATDWAFAAKMHLQQIGDVTGLLQGGLFLSQDLGSAPTTADWETVRTTQGSANFIQTASFTAYNAASTLRTQQGRTDRDVYFRVRVTGTTSVKLDWSSEGIGWHEMRAFTIAFTPVHFGVWSRNTSGGTARIRVQWFRVAEATVGVGDLVPGGRVLNVYA